MKEGIKIGAIISLVIMVLAYLSGSFYSVSFNIADWTEGTRSVVLVFSFILSSVVMFLSVAFPYEDF